MVSPILPKNKSFSLSSHITRFLYISFAVILLILFIGYLLRDKINFTNISSAGYVLPSQLNYRFEPDDKEITFPGVKIRVKNSWGLVKNPAVPSMFFNGQMDENYLAVQVSQGKSGQTVPEFLENSRQSSVSPVATQLLTINGRTAGLVVMSVNDSDLFHTGLDQLSFNVFIPGKTGSSKLLIVTTGNYYRRHVGDIRNLIASFSPD